MHFQTVSLALLGASTVAASDVVSLFIPFADEQPAVGKVIGTKGSMTSYAVYCPSNTNSEDCGFPEDGMTMVQGPSSYEMVYSFEDYTESIGCSFGSKTIDCVVSMADSTTSQVSSVAVPTSSISFMPVTITATESGSDSSSSASATTKASASQTTATATGSSTGTETAKSTLSSSASSTATGSDSASTAAASATDSGNAALAQATANAHWIAGGAAMAVALAFA